MTVQTLPFERNIGVDMKQGVAVDIDLDRLTADCAHRVVDPWRNTEFEIHRVSPSGPARVPQASQD